MKSLVCLLVLSCLLLDVNGQLSTAPQQIHLAYGDSPSIMTVTWSTAGDDSSSVAYGLSASELTYEAQADSVSFTLGNPKGLQWVHRASMINLQPTTNYYYQVTTGNSSSEVYMFTSMSTDPNWSPVFLVYGDMGRDGGAISLPLLKKEVAAGGIAAIIHVGDFAYDLDTNGGVTGDEFMQRIQPMATSVPYMTCIGNHELAYNLSHYINRFYMPNQKSRNMWYSWNAGLIHFIAYSSEVFFDTNAKLQDMLDWLKADLAQANANRDKQPWVIAYGHRPMYCSNIDGDDCTTEKSIVRAGLEELFYHGGIDLIIEAHEHSYERLWPVWNETVTQKDYNNPLAPVHLVAGSAGCNEQSGICVNPIFGPKGPWSAFSAWFLAYGYGHLQAINATHLYWDQILDLTGEKLDAMTIIQTQHGPFPHN